MTPSGRNIVNHQHHVDAALTGVAAAAGSSVVTRSSTLPVERVVVGAPSGTVEVGAAAAAGTPPSTVTAGATTTTPSTGGNVDERVTTPPLAAPAAAPVESDKLTPHNSRRTMELRTPHYGFRQLQCFGMHHEEGFELSLWLQQFVTALSTTKQRVCLRRSSKKQAQQRHNSPYASIISTAGARQKRRQRALRFSTPRGAPQNQISRNIMGVSISTRKKRTVRALRV